MTWRGAELKRRKVRGRGGKSGLSYEVLVSSLPSDLQRRYSEQWATDPGATILRQDDPANAWRNFVWHVIEPALKHPKRSAERADEIRKTSSVLRIWPGKLAPTTVSAEQIRRWIADYERDGFTGLQRKARRDRGRRRVIISARWDKATAALGDVRVEVAEELRTYIRALVKAGESGVSLNQLVSRKLWELTSTAGYRGGDLRAICRVPRSFIEPELIYRKVREFRTDRKAYMDRAAPRVLRTRAGLSPMDIVVGDVHPVDILVRREDDSVATFRAIAWLDLATNRIWNDLVLLGKGEGIRNEHVIASFRRMVAAWGAPRALYLDNGSEYLWAAFVDDALKLIDRATGACVIGEIGGGGKLSQIIKALPYNAAAKPIEGIFGVLEARHFSLIPGWIGGDRLRKKSANVGKEPEPFPGSAPECAALILSAVDYYHNTPQRGSLNGRSPNSAYADAIKAGWGKTEVAPETFAIAFSTEETRVIKQGRFSYGGRFWTSPEIVTLQDDTVQIRVPKYEDWAQLPVFSKVGELIGFAEPDIAYEFRDPAGAVEAHARRKAHRSAVLQLGRTAPDIDPLTERMKYLDGQPAAPVAPVIATIGASDQARAIASGLRESAEDRSTRRQRDIDRNQAIMLELDEKRRRMQSGGT